MSAQKIIVTGLSGLVGSHFRARFGDRYEMIPIDIAEGVDLTDPEAVGKVFNENPDADTVVHLAAFTNVSAASEQENDEQGLCYRLNVGGTENVVREALKHGMHFVHVSTDFVFNGENSKPYIESDVPKPIEWYGKTKYLAEEVVKRELSAYTLMRLAFPYIPGDAARDDLVAGIRKRLAAGEKLSLFDDQQITPTYAGDIVKALELFTRTKQSGETFHVVGSTSLTPYKLGLEIANVFGHDPKLIGSSSLADFLKTDPRPRQKNLQISNRKYAAFAESHGMEAPFAIREGLECLREASS